MFSRSPWKALLLAGFGLALAGCTNNQVDSITVAPATQPLTVGQTVQFSATGIENHGSHPSTNSNVTNLVTWSSSTPAVATVNSAGLATAVAAGTTTISASMPGFGGTVTGTATITVTGSATGGTGGSIASISIIPGTQAVAAPTDTAQFIAIGTTTNGATTNLTSQVTWTSSSAQIATIGASTGLATGVGQGTATITALYSPSGSGSSVVTGTAQFTVSGGVTEQYTAVKIVPVSLDLSAGQTSQFVAIGTLGSSGLLVDVTSSAQITWSSSSATGSGAIATVSAAGLVTGKSAGTATITAELTNPDKTVVTASGTVTVSATTVPEPLLSLTIIPATITVNNLQGTGQFLAIGTFSTAPYVQDLTNSPNTTWISSFPDDFPVDTNSGGTSSASAGIVTAYASGTATIIAEYQNPSDKTIQTATATFNCPLELPNPGGNPPTAGSCYTGQSGPLKATLTVYGEGLDTKDWVLTAPSATGTPDVIHCGPGWTAEGGTGGSVCTGIYPIGTTVTITAGQAPTPAVSTPPTNPVTTAFGGWTYNCTPTAPISATGPNSCTINLGATNASVGAIFN